jgi:hypothetical protein
MNEHSFIYQTHSKPVKDKNTQNKHSLHRGLPCHIPSHLPRVRFFRFQIAIDGDRDSGLEDGGYPILQIDQGMPQYGSS